MPRCARHVADELGSAARTITTERRRFLSQDGERVLRKVIALVSHPEMTNAYPGGGGSGSTYVCTMPSERYPVCRRTALKPARRGCSTFLPAAAGMGLRLCSGLPWRAVPRHFGSESESMAARRRQAHTRRGQTWNAGTVLAAHALMRSAHSEPAAGNCSNKRAIQRFRMRAFTAG